MATDAEIQKIINTAVIETRADSAHHLEPFKEFHRDEMKVVREYVGGRFEAVDRRFDAVDERFKKVDERFDRVDERFDTVERRLDTLETEMREVNSTLQNAP